MALVRTSLSIIVFGFIVEKFDLFLQESFKVPSSERGFYHILGLLVTLEGILIALYTVIYYKKQLRYLREGKTKDDELFFYLITISVVIFGFGLFLGMLIL